MIEFESVSRPSRRGSDPVAEVTFAAHPGQITVLLGAPGSGTSTVLRMINRLIEPAEGRIMINGNPLRSQRRKALRRSQGFLLREGGLFPHRTVVDNIAMVPRLKAHGRGKALVEAGDLLRSVGLDKALDRAKPSRLTADQRQRVCLARAIAGEPTAVLLDHPFGDLEPRDRAAMQVLLRRLHAERPCTVVVATDDVDEALAIADRMIVFADGRVIDSGPPEAILDASDTTVAHLVGAERGYRALAYATTIGLPLQRVPVVRDPASADADAGATLLVDNDAVPLGWVDPERPGAVLPLGDVFDPGHGSLQDALNAALTSPVGLAVAVTPGTGRYAGVLSAAEIVAAAVDQRAAAVRAGIGSAGLAEPATDAVTTEPAATEPATLEVTASEIDAPESEIDAQEVETDTPDGDRSEVSGTAASEDTGGTRPADGAAGSADHAAQHPDGRAAAEVAITPADQADRTDAEAGTSVARRAQAADGKATGEPPAGTEDREPVAAGGGR